MTTKDYVMWYNQKLQLQPDYLQADVNLDGQVDMYDKSLCFEGAREGFESVAL
jgi:hypothetical protein